MAKTSYLSGDNGRRSCHKILGGLLYRSFCHKSARGCKFFNQIDLPSIPTTQSCPDLGDLPKFFRDFKYIDIEALLNDVSNLNWSDFFAANDVNVKLQMFNSFIVTLFERHVRLKESKPVNRVNTWLHSK
jgi:hypothetical protein